MQRLLRAIRGRQVVSCHQAPEHSQEQLRSIPEYPHSRVPRQPSGISDQALRSQSQPAPRSATVAKALTAELASQRLKVCDGAGLRSTADHSTPSPNRPLSQVLHQTWCPKFGCPTSSSPMQASHTGCHCCTRYQQPIIQISTCFPCLQKEFLRAPSLECIGNWKAAEAEPDTVSALLDKEIASGWIVHTDMSVEEARQHWPRAQLAS